MTMSFTAPASPDAFDARLVSIRYAARDTCLFEFARIDGEPLAATEPGAHVDVILPNGLTRQYSLIDAQDAPQSYTVAIKRDGGGRGGSRFIHDELRVGAMVKLAGPRNNFPLVENADGIVLFAGGIGITPIRCMVQRLRARGARWTLHYACRARDEIAFLGELQPLENVHLHIDAEQSGRLLDIAGIVAAAPRQSHLYCCGPGPMLSAFEAAAAGWPAEQVHVEYFTPKSAPATEGGFVVELARSGRSFTVPEGKTILDVLLEAGLDVPFSCEQGICGSCETRIISGIPDHRDAVLTPAEQATNKTAMICCAGSKTDRLVLDL
jgi:ferredoxin-NADP reductase